MSVMRCDKHDWFWDSDDFRGCPKCDSLPADDDPPDSDAHRDNLEDDRRNRGQRR